MFKVRKFWTDSTEQGNYSVIWGNSNFVRIKCESIFFLLIYCEPSTWTDTSTWASNQPKCLGKICFDANERFPQLLGLKTKTTGNIKNHLHQKTKMIYNIQRNLF